MLCVQQLTLDKTRNRREASEAFEVCVCVCVCTRVFGWGWGGATCTACSHEPCRSLLPSIRLVSRAVRWQISRYVMQLLCL